MTSTAPRSYRGMSAEERRGQRRSQFIEAGLELFGTLGIEGTRIDDLCAEAGLTKRYFYESFTSIDELVEAVVDHVVADLAAVVVPVVAAGGWREPRAVLAAITEPIAADPRLARLLIVETHTGSLITRRQQLIETAVDLSLAADPDSLKGPEHLATRRLLAHAMGGAWAEVALGWVNGRIELSIEEVIDQLAGMFERMSPSRR